MNILFYISAAVALIATFMMITNDRAIHALLYLVVSFFALALVFVALGAPLMGVLEVIVYAGAIMVLLVFAVMLLNPSPTAPARRAGRIVFGARAGPAILGLVLLVELIYALRAPHTPAVETLVTPEQVGLALYGPYMLGVELASFILLAGLVGAHHLNAPSLEDAPEDATPSTSRVILAREGGPSPGDAPEAPAPGSSRAILAHESSAPEESQDRQGEGGNG